MNPENELMSTMHLDGGEDNGGHGTDQRDIEDGDGKGGSGSPGH